MIPTPPGLTHISELFTIAEARQTERIEHDFTQGHFQGFDELFAFFNLSIDRFASIAEIKPLTVLIDRLRQDFETGLMSFLCGMDQATFDAMRDVMEIGYLLRDFTMDHSHVAEWFSLDDLARLKRYTPNTLRQRYATSRRVAVVDLPDSKEYRAHSSMLHVSPSQDWLIQRGVSRSQHAQFGASFALADLMHHARDTVFLLNAFPSEFSADLQPLDEAVIVPKLREAFEHTMKRYDSSLMWVHIATKVAEVRAADATDQGA
jgi:hypothetical protein